MSAHTQSVIAVISAAVGVLTLVVTSVYVMLTYRLLTVSQAMVKATKEQIQNEGRPYIQVVAKPRPGNQVLQLSISNVGRSAARNLTLTLEPEFRQFHRKDAEPLQALPLFSSEIQSFPPSCERLFDLGVGYQFFQGPDNDRISPPRFTVRARYSDHSESYDELTEVDLRLFLQTTASKYGELAELDEMKRHLGTISGVLRDLSRSYEKQLEAERTFQKKRSWKFR